MTVGVLLAQIGTPDAPTAEALQTLPETISFRPPGDRLSADFVAAAAARHYLAHAAAQVSPALRPHLDRRRIATAGAFESASSHCAYRSGWDPNTVSSLGMTYGNPSIDQRAMSEFEKEWH